MSKIKIMSANRRGLASKTKRLDIMNYFKKQNVSILCLQHTHISPEIGKSIYNCIQNGIMNAIILRYHQIHVGLQYFLIIILNSKVLKNLKHLMAMLLRLMLNWKASGLPLSACMVQTMMIPISMKTLMV